MGRRKKRAQRVLHSAGKPALRLWPALLRTWFLVLITVGVQRGKTSQGFMRKPETK
jgi:hypothetical protein